MDRPSARRPRVPSPFSAPSLLSGRASTVGRGSGGIGSGINDPLSEGFARAAATVRRTNAGRTVPTGATPATSPLPELASSTPFGQRVIPVSLPVSGRRSSVVAPRSSSSSSPSAAATAPLARATAATTTQPPPLTSGRRRTTATTGVPFAPALTAPTTPPLSSRRRRTTATAGVPLAQVLTAPTIAARARAATARSKFGGYAKNTAGGGSGGSGGGGGAAVRATRAARGAFGASPAGAAARSVVPNYSRLMREDEDLQTVRRAAMEEAARQRKERRAAAVAAAAVAAAAEVGRPGREREVAAAAATMRAEAAGAATRVAGAAARPIDASLSAVDGAGQPVGPYSTGGDELGADLGHLDADMAAAIHASLAEYNTVQNEQRRRGEGEGTGRGRGVMRLGVGEGGDNPEVDTELQRALQISYETSVARGGGGGGGGGGVKGERRGVPGGGAAERDLPAWLLDEGAEAIYQAAAREGGGFGAGGAGRISSSGSAVNGGVGGGRLERENPERMSAGHAGGFGPTSGEFRGGGGGEGGRGGEDDELARVLEMSRLEFERSDRGTAVEVNADAGGVLRESERRNPTLVREVVRRVGVSFADVGAADSEALRAKTRREQDEEFRSGLEADRRREAAAAAATGEREALAAAVAVEAARDTAARAVESERARHAAMTALDTLRAFAAGGDRDGIERTSITWVETNSDAAAVESCELMIDVAPLGRRLRHRFDSSTPCSAVHLYVRRQISIDALAEAESAGAGAGAGEPNLAAEDAAALLSGGFTLVPAFGSGGLADAEDVTLAAAGVARRDKFIVRGTTPSP